MPESDPPPIPAFRSLPVWAPESELSMASRNRSTFRYSGPDAEGDMSGALQRAGFREPGGGADLLSADQAVQAGGTLHAVRHAHPSLTQGVHVVVHHRLPPAANR